MIKKLAIAGAVCLLATATGCESVEVPNDDAATQTYEQQRVSDIENDYIVIVTDHKTGVQYIVYREPYRGGITPRLNPDGSLCVVDVGNTTTEEEDFEYDTSEE